MKIKKIAQSLCKVVAILLALFLTFQISTMTVNACFADDLAPARIQELYSRSVELNSNKDDYIDFVPLYNQRAYPITGYGKWESVATNGCGLVSVWMVATYLNNEIYDIDDLINKFGDYATKNGSLWKLFMDSAEELDLNIVLSDCPNGEWYSWDMVVEALANGQPVICLQSNGLFTTGGHFIVLAGLTEDGKVLVNDPNGRNWYKNQELMYGFENGFEAEQIRDGAVAYWIYDFA